MWISKPTNSRLIQPPTQTPLSVAAAAQVQASTSLALEEYLRQRNWAEPNTTTLLASPGLRILSHLLSYPMTLAHYLPHLQKVAEATKTKKEEAAAAVHLAILGARAEASLPSAWWMELLCLRCIHLHLHMVGPEMPHAVAKTAARAAEHVVLDADRQLWLHKHHGLYHELVADIVSSVTSSSSSSAAAAATAAAQAPGGGSLDAIVLYNPGLGHPALSTAWAPTLAKLQAERKPVLWTAHSQEDRDRDIALLGAQEKDVEWLVGPERNPFASRKRLVDPLDARHVLAANEYAGVFRWRI
eukprot:evm.model.NODE_16477_length_6640_cov_25.901356.1